ncbi:MAG: hypothetical protein ABIR28_15135 [Vicinamibacteria bacterium]
MNSRNALLIKTEAWWAIKMEQSETCIFFRDRGKAIKVGLAMARQWGGKLIVQGENAVVPTFAAV